MVFLVAAILCSAAIALLFKFSETRDHNRYAVTSANYLVALLVSTAMMWGRGPGEGAPVSLTLWLGLGAGILFFAGFILFQISIRHNGAGLTGSFAKMGILVPLCASLIWWREFPGSYQWSGIGFSLAAITAVCFTKREDKGPRTRLLLPLVLLVVGCAEFSNKIFQKYGPSDQASLFLAAAFGVAFLCSLGFTLGRRQATRRGDILLGCLVGIPNLFSAWFLIEALHHLPAAVVFPVFSAGSTVLILLGGSLLFGERLETRDRLAVALVLPALVLVNL
ncbi:MAG: DMT family transporter [Acidobacteriota bacterium]|nr:DMT family transporter [Acidobacteriota bacterium]